MYHALFFRFCCAFGVVTFAAATKAQTLNDQYDYYLSSSCEHLNFERVDGNQVAPGLAGANLAKYCGRPQANIPGATGTNSQGGTSAAAGTSAPNALQREQKSRDDEAAPANSTDIFQGDRVGIFVTVNRRKEDKTASPFEAGSNARGQDVLLGVDYRLSPQTVLGIAYQQMSLDGDFNNGGQFDNQHQTLWLFGAWFPRKVSGAFANWQLGYGQGDQQIRRYVGRDTTVVNTQLSISPTTMEVVEERIVTTVSDIEYSFTEGDSNTHSLNATLNGGYDFHTANITFGPRLGLNYQKLVQDAFTESGSTPMTLAFDAQRETSAISTLGLHVGHTWNTAMGVINTQLDANWLHEWRDQQQTFTATFAEDLRSDATQLRFQNQAPDQNWLNLRLASVMILPHNLSAFLALEHTAQHAYVDRKVISIGLRKMF